MTRRILVVHGSKRGGTAEIAERIARSLRERGFLVHCAPASSLRDLEPYDAVIVGGGLYASRWVREARRFVTRHAAALRQRPVWMFSSGPLDDSAARRDLPPVRRVAALVAHVGARDHRTFGGRLARDATGVLAAAMAKKLSGDWRDWAQVDAWAASIGAWLVSQPDAIAAPAARPRRWPLAALCLAVGVTAIGGGIALVADPDGAYVRTPVAILAHSPFTSFLIPGLLLLLIVGAGNAIAGTLVARDSHRGDRAALLGGAALLVWIVAEIALLRTINAFHLAYLVIAIAIVGAATHRARSHARTALP